MHLDKLIYLVCLNSYIKKLNKKKFNSDLLWMAPEHIRTAIVKNDVATVMTSSSAGDVYSFGIIMQEVILRGAPFCMLDLTPQGYKKTFCFYFQFSLFFE